MDEAESAGSFLTYSTEEALPLRRDRGFRLWFAADTFQSMSRAFTSVALPLLAIGTTSSPAAAGLVVAAGAVGSSVALLPGGALADRLDRGFLVTILASLAALAYFLIAAFSYVSLPVYDVWLTCLVFLASLLQSMVSPAFSATLKSLVPADKFASAASLSEGRSAALGLAVPTAGGTLYMFGGWLPFVVAAGMTLLASYLYRRLPNRVTAAVWANATAKDRGFWSGITFVCRNGTLGTLVLTATVVNFAASAVMIATVFHMRTHGVSASLVGLSTSVVAIGSMLGAILAAYVVPRARGGRLITLSLLWITFTLAPTGAVADSTFAVITLITFAILAAPVLNSVFGGYLVAKVPRALQGRVDSAVSFFSSAAAPVAPLMAGFGLEVLGYSGTVTLCAVIVGVAGIPAMASSGVRAIPRPDHWASNG